MKFSMVQERYINRPREYTRAELEPVLAEYRKLREASTEYLKSDVKTTHRIVDIRGLSRSNLINMILTAKFGGSKVEQALKLR